MDARSRWRRLDAEHWVHVAGMVLTTVLVLCTFWTALAGLVEVSSSSRCSLVPSRRWPAG